MHRYVIVDVFTDAPLEGNAVAVFTDGRDLSSKQMQRIAREMNLSETVFVLPSEQGGNARIRIFTPGSELPFAGHPTLGTAFVLGQRRRTDGLRIETGSGIVPVALERREGRIVSGRMRQPIPTWEPYPRAEELLAALGVARFGLPVETYSNGPVYAYVELENERAVAALEPDLGALGRLLGQAGVYCFAGSGTRWRARMFAPGVGVVEDPATGSAAGPFAVHLARHGRISFGKEIEIRQGEEIGRPSRLYARATGSTNRIERVEVAGSAVVVGRGELDGV